MSLRHVHVASVLLSVLHLATLQQVPSPVSSTTPTPTPTLCEVSSNVPSSVRTNDSVWQRNQAPARDLLDDYIINRTGCQLDAASWSAGWRSLGGLERDGSVRRVGVRADEYVYLSITADTVGPRYDIWIGQDNSTQLHQVNPAQELAQQSTPGILSRNKYTFFYIKLDGHRLTFGSECSERALFSLELPLPKEPLDLLFQTGALHGVKILVCPPNTAGHP